MDLIAVTLIVSMLSAMVIADPQVCLKHKQCLRGVYMPGYQTEKFEAFLGIPYAKPPVNELRFADTVPAEPWRGYFDATGSKMECIQKNYLQAEPIVIGSEDCLYLNIYRPLGLSNCSKLLPVMVYIHGGAFVSGTANPLAHGPEYFMDSKQVILVTLNYRLGAFGFLSTGDQNAPGNLAFKDQAMALKWVNKNILKFGGNPNLVTIFGQSAGGASVHMLMLSPMTKGLFQRAISMSGNAIAPYNTLSKDPLAQARLQAKYADIENAETLTSEKLIAALREIDAKAIVDAGDKFKYWHIDPLTVFRPVIDNTFLKADPVELITNGTYHNVPWMTSFVDFEGGVRSLSIIANETLLKQFNERFDELFFNLMEIPVQSIEEKQSVVDRIVNFYLNGSHELTAENAHQFGDIISDRAFLMPMYNTVKQMVKNADAQSAPIFFYKFNYRGPYSYSLYFSESLENYGVVHCDDLIYLFRSPSLFPDFGRDSVEAKLIKTFVDTFVTFAKTGQGIRGPKPCTLQQLNDNSFCEYHEYKNSYNDFRVSTTNSFNKDAVRFWDDILKQF